MTYLVLLLVCLLPHHFVRAFVAPWPVAETDLSWFPPRGEVKAEWLFNRRCRDALNELRNQAPDLATAEYYGEMVNYLDWSYARWNELDDAQRNSGEVRLQNLCKLRRVLGAGAYWRGEMPPSVPWWLFRRDDR